MTDQEPKTDKRKVSSSKNLIKAREAKLNKLRQKKEEKQYDIVSESDSDSDSDSEVILIQPKKKKKQSSNLNLHITKELSELKNMLQNLTVKRKKPKSRNSKQIIKIVNPPAQPTEKKSNPDLDTLKKRMLINFNFVIYMGNKDKVRP